MSAKGRSRIFSDPSRASDCLVLRTWPTGETSVIASLLSAEDGYLRVIAKGARAQQSRLRGVVQPCSLVNLEYSWREDRDLQFLRGGQLLVSPLQDSTSLERSACLMAMVEMLDRCRLDREHAPGLFEFCREYLSVLSSVGDQAEISAFYAFELALLDFHGLAPSFTDCVSCGGGIHTPDRGAVVFDIDAGGLVCAECRDTQRTDAVRRLDGETLGYLSGLQAGLESVVARTAAPSRSTRRAAGALLHYFLSYHLSGYRLPAGLDMLRVPKSSGPNPESLAAMEDETA